jgi:eukaryotic-like serine/threonine-protein kinase
MSLLSRLRSWIQPGTSRDEADASSSIDPFAPSEASLPVPVPAPDAFPGEDSDSAVLPQIKRLARVGLPSGPTVEEAIALLRQVRGTIHEAAAVSHSLREHSLRPIPEPVRVACADILAVRGDEQGALRVLDGTTSMPGLILAADLHAASGQLARAVGTIERVLARDLDAPGARERHARWTLALGYTRREPRRLDEATVVAPRAGSGPFRLLREVARGGAGAVYEAEDRVLGRRVAFKVYHGRGADSALLEREARLAAALAGPGILRVFDADPGEGWLALEWVARGSVRDVLRTGDFSPLLPIGRWARPLARALCRVHAEGLVHADIKPANVLLRQPQDPILGDFGSARPLGDRAEGGSPGYLSPERLAGRSSHPRDDIYGYGRVIEDVLHRIEESGGSAGGEAEAFRALSLSCIGPDEGRAADGADLLRRLP